MTRPSISRTSDSSLADPTCVVDPQLLVSLEEHRAAVLDASPLLPAERLALDQAHGHTMAEAVRARYPLPAFDNAAMDGFAVRFADTTRATPRDPVTLRVIADVPAGSAEDPTLPAGTAARIMTGAPIPTDADTVVPFEDTVGGLTGSLDAALIIRTPRSEGAHVRRAGEDVTAGMEVVAVGTRLGPLHLSAIASVGVGEVVVTRAPRVAVISTGSELVEPGTTLGPGRIPESNSRMLASLAVECGAMVVCRVSIPDDRDRLREVLAEVTAPSATPRADVVIFSGGVSAGAFEVVKQTLDRQMHFTQVAMRPGRPQGFGVIGDGTLLFGLPGNPVSAAVSFEAFVRPALMKMQGRIEKWRQTLMLPTTSGWRSPSGLVHFVPVAIDRSDPGRWSVSPAGPAGSHRAGTLARADGYAVVPVGVDAVAAGDLVDVLMTNHP